MKQCEKCLFYNETIDKLLQPDYVIDGEEPLEFHRCDIYKIIPKGIISDKRQCKHFVDTEISNMQHDEQ